MADGVPLRRRARRGGAHALHLRRRRRSPSSPLREEPPSAPAAIPFVAVREESPSAPAAIQQAAAMAGCSCARRCSRRPATSSVLELHLRRFALHKCDAAGLAWLLHRRLTAVHGPVPSTGGTAGARVGGVLAEELLLGQDLEMSAASSSNSPYYRASRSCCCSCGIHHMGRRAWCSAGSGRWQAASSEGRARKAARGLGCELEGDELHEARVCEALLLWIRTAQCQEIGLKVSNAWIPMWLPLNAFEPIPYVNA